MFIGVLRHLNLDIHSLTRYNTYTAKGVCKMVRWIEYKARCHVCGKMVTLKDHSLGVKPIKLTFPWREVSLPGWISTFDVCSDDCESALRDQYPDSGYCPLIGGGSEKE